MQIQDLVVDVEQEVEIAAPRSVAFDALVLELTEGHLGQNDTPLPLELERKPGGRWFRNLGEGRGHFWGFIQSIREPDLLEITGPLFMSYPVSNHLIFRLEEIEQGTLLRFRHRALGLIEEQHREGVVIGWNRMLEKVRTRASA